MSDWFSFDDSFASAGADAMAAPAPAPRFGGLFGLGQGGACGGLFGGGLFGGGAGFGNLGLPNMGLLRFGAALMSPEPSAWSRAATAQRQGAAFDQKLRKELAARAAAANAAGSNVAGTLGTSGLRDVDPALMLRLAALVETQRDEARTSAPGASSSLGPMRGARPAGAPAAGAARTPMQPVSQRPGPPLRIRLDAQGRRIG
jgi:hypothetical protein